MYHCRHAFHDRCIRLHLLGARPEKQTPDSTVVIMQAEDLLQRVALLLGVAEQSGGASGHLRRVGISDVLSVDDSHLVVNALAPARIAACLVHFGLPCWCFVAQQAKIQRFICCRVSYCDPMLPSAPKQGPARTYCQAVGLFHLDSTLVVP